MAPSKIIVAGLGPRWTLEGQALPFDNLSLHLETFIRAFGSKMSSQRHQDKSGVLWGDVCELAPEWQRSQFKSVSFLPKASFIVASTGKEVRSYCQKKIPRSVSWVSWYRVGRDRGETARQLAVTFRYCVSPYPASSPTTCFIWGRSSHTGGQIVNL